MNYLRLILNERHILFLALMFLITSCGGGGSNENSSTSSNNITTPNTNLSGNVYEKLTDNLTNKTWDAVGTAMVFGGLPAGDYTYNGQALYLDDFMDRSTWGYSGYSNYSLDINATQVNSNTYDIDFSGDTSSTEYPLLSFNLNFNAWNQEITDLYEFGETEPSYSSRQATFADSTVTVFGPYNDYLQSLGIDYATGYQLVGLSSTGQYYTLPIAVGDITETSDLPSGTSSANFNTISYYYEEDYDVPYSIFVAVTGYGNINFNHNDNTVTGSITLDNWMDLEEFLVGNGPQNQFTTISDKTISITNGQITGNKFSADLVLDDLNITGVYLIGGLQGAFYGPNGDEIAASYFLVDGSNDESDFYTASGFLVGE